MALATELLGPADLDVQVLVPRRDISWLENGGGGLGGWNPKENGGLSKNMVVQAGKMKVSPAKIMI